MRIDVLTLFPEMIEQMVSHSILRRAQKSNAVEIVAHNIRDYSTDKHRKVDDYQFGGGAGMVMTIQPIADCIEQLQNERKYDAVIFLTPDGTPLQQKKANELSLLENVILLCGHYKGIDQRVRDVFVTDEISIGDYVLTGGELAAGVLIDAMVRLIPGVLSDETSALSDSFQDELLSAPVYTRPADYNGHKVPDVLLSGNFKNIDDWRHEQALKKTETVRPDLLQ